MKQQVEKPKKRSVLRKKLGKEYFILKRQYRWRFKGTKWAKEYSKESFSNSIIKHQSFLLRPLKDVDMYLQHNKVENLRLAIANINNIVIKPNETFSLWKLVGRPTKRKGYLDGMTLSNGTIQKGTGGGLCQLGNLLFWMIMHSPLKVEERWRHSYDVFPDVNRKIPFGSGATLSYNYIDLQFKNTTNNDFQLKLWLDESHLHGELLTKNPLNKSFRVFEEDHHFQQQWWGGYTRHNKIVREITHKNGEIEKEVVTENHAIMMYTPFLDENQTEQA